jgi:hypothetical protein
MNDYYLEKSNKPTKKFMVTHLNSDTGKLNTIHFGAKGFSDYILSNDDNKKKAYIARHKVKEDFNDLKTSGAWALGILWNKESIESSIKDMEKHFKIKIHYVK